MNNLTNPTLELTFLGNDLEQGHAVQQTVSSAMIVRYSVNFTQKLINNLKSSSNQVTLQLHRNCASTEDIISTEGDIKAVLKDDGTPVFTGYLSTNFSWSVTANGEQALSITLEGVGTRLLNKVYSSASVYFSGTASSAVSSICQACGITVASASANVLTEGVSATIEAGETCRDILDQLLYECNAVYYFNPEGELCISKINPSTFGADTIDSDELYVINGNAVSVSKSLRQYNNARVAYTELGTADNYLVYRNTTGQDATHPYCKLDIPGGNYFDGTEIYTAQQWSEATADAFREPAVISAVNAASEQKVGSNDIINISNLSKTVVIGAGSFSTEFVHKGGPNFSLTVHNSSTVAGYLTRLDLYASIVYVKSTSVIRASATGDYNSKMLDEELVWIHDKSLAQAHANLLCQYHKSASARYSFYASRDLELGKVYRLRENAFSGLDVYVLITGKNFGDSSEIASYTAVGVSTFNLGKDVYYQTEMEGVTAPPQGKPGTTFTPSVSEEGVISWTNDGGQENPPAVSIKGPAGNASKYWGVLNTPPMGAADGDYFVFGLCGETYETTDEGKIFVYSNADWEELPFTAENNEKILVAYADILAKKDDTAYFSEPPTNSGTIQYAKVLMANAIVADAVKATDGFFDNITATDISVLGNSLFKGRIDSPALTTVNGGEGETEDIVLTQGAQLSKQDALSRWLSERITNPGIYPIEGTYSEYVRLGSGGVYEIYSRDLNGLDTFSFIAPVSFRYQFRFDESYPFSGYIMHVTITSPDGESRSFDTKTRYNVEIKKGSSVEVSGIGPWHCELYASGRNYVSNTTGYSTLPYTDDYTLTYNGETYDHANLYYFEGMPISNASGTVSTAKTNTFSLVQEDGTAYNGSVKSVWWETASLARITLTDNTVVTLRSGYVRSLSATFSILKTDLYAEVTDLIPKDDTTDIGTVNRPFKNLFVNHIFSSDIENVSEYIGVDVSKKRNLFNKDSSTSKTRVSGADGTLDTFSTLTCSVSDFIDVSGMSRITISGNVTVQNATSHRYAFYNSNKNFITGLVNDTEYGTFLNATIDVPSNAKYFRFNFMPQDDVMVNEGSSPSDYVPYIPTLREGSIVAYGGNDSTGYYVRFANGVQMCWKDRGVGDISISSAWGVLYVSNEYNNNTYPMPFADIPIAIVSTSSTNSCFCLTTSPATTTKWQNVQFARGNSYSLVDARLKFYAIGRWK